MNNRWFSASFLFALIVGISASFAETPVSPQVLKDGAEIKMEFSKLLKEKEDYKDYAFILNQIPTDGDDKPMFKAGEFSTEDGGKFVFALYSDRGVEGICDTPGCPFAIFMKKDTGYHRAMYIDLKVSDQAIFKKTKEGLSVLFCEEGGMRGEATWELKGETFKMTGVKKNTATCPEDG